MSGRGNSPPAAPTPIRFRVRGLSLLPAVPPGAVVEVESPAVRRPRPGDLVVVDIGGARVCHVLESGGEGGPWVTRGLWAERPDPPVPPGGLVGRVIAVRVGGLRIPSTGGAFRAWLALGRSVAPLSRWVRAAAWSRLPPGARERLRQGLHRRRP